jgi:hypothetical protein
MVKTEKTARGILLTAADLVDIGWTQGNYVVYGGKPGGPECYCASGAIIRAGYLDRLQATPQYREAFDLFRRVIGTGNIVEWNDDPNRTQAEVSAKLREAADLV